MKPQRPSGLRFLDNLAYLVPGYKGYKQRELRYEEDSRLRAYVQGQVLEMLQALDQIHERWSAEDWGNHMDHLNQRRMRLQTIAESMCRSPNGFTGFFTSETLDEPLLEQILAADLQIREDLEATVEFLGEQHGAVTTAPRTSRSFFRVLDEGVGRLERHLISRERILAAASEAAA
jgi:hypothetical protein